MAPDNAQNSFRRGMMALVILALLKKEDMYGYQLVQQTVEASGGRILTQEGSLYPVLYKLLDQGFISDRKVQVGKRMTRIYYHLEPAGEQRLEELIWEYEQITIGIHKILEERAQRKKHYKIIIAAFAGACRVPVIGGSRSWAASSKQ